MNMLSQTRGIKPCRMLWTFPHMREMKLLQKLCQIYGGANNIANTSKSQHTCGTGCAKDVITSRLSKLTRRGKHIWIPKTLLSSGKITFRTIVHMDLVQTQSIVEFLIAQVDFNQLHHDFGP